MPSIAVLIPCFNEETTIAGVVSDFNQELPTATVYVFDNNSSDRTSEVAQKAGATVLYENWQGKGNVVRSMFRKIEADIYVMVDGDSTYPPSAVHQLIEPIASGEAEMTVGDRLSSQAYQKENKRPFHEFGNNLVRNIINFLFKSDLKDIMSGYRAFSRLYVKNCPVMSEGFEIETELTLHSLDKRLKVIECPINYRDRPEGSNSKLNTFRDGIRILKTILWVFKDYKPIIFFTTLAGAFAVAGILIGLLPILDYVREGYVYRVPSAILAASLEIVAILLAGVGLTLDTLVTQNKELFELRILGYKDRNRDL